MRDYPQESHPDLGLWPDSDHTEDMRTAPVSPVLPAPAGAALIPHKFAEESR